MSFGWRSLLKGCAVIVILAASARAGAANDTGSIPQIMVDLIRKGTNIDAAPSANYSRVRQTLRLAKPAIAPNDFAHNINFSRVLAAFDNVPVINNNEVDLGQRPIYQRLLGLKDDLVVSTREPSAAENNSSLDQARKLLFKPNGLPTEAYATYLRYESDHKRMLEKLNAETDSANQQQQRAALLQLEREWEVLGNRTAIASAISQYESGRRQADPGRMQAWLASIKPAPIPDALSLALLGNQWLRFSLSNTSSDPISATTPTGAVSTLGGLRRISFDATIVWIDRAYLTSPLLTDRGWKTRSGRVVSSGIDEATDDLVPEVVSALLVCKNVEIQLADELPGPVVDLLKGDQDFSIDAFLITKKPSIPYGFQAHQLTLPGPAVLGAVVDRLRKIPDPAPGREWPN